MILQIVLDENEPSIREVLNCSTDELIPMLRDVNGSTYLPVNKILKPAERQSTPLEQMKEVASALWSSFQVTQLENGSIIVRDDGHLLPQAKPVLRDIARQIGVNPMNSMGNAKNTRSLGSDIIKALG
ncbi:hypothetical protein [Paracoccus sp. JM45]|uniref:hypothetical protein n=1 Tax=Paracoccus sp. JM45 TaxID=2283626 RepID=UPI000E6BF811|nr:hypothetical protein [Paracoccus sp. JM45]RJE80019.1 hypothetical protein DWB67_10025 [Paracoccus sp. JM45]